MDVSVQDWFKDTWYAIYTKQEECKTKNNSELNIIKLKKLLKVKPVEERRKGHTHKSLKSNLKIATTHKEVSIPMDAHVSTTAEGHGRSNSQ